MKPQSVATSVSVYFRFLDFLLLKFMIFKSFFHATLGSSRPPILRGFIRPPNAGGSIFFSAAAPLSEPYFFLMVLMPPSLNDFSS